MADRKAEMQSSRPALFASLAVCVILAACSSTSESTMTFFAAPGKYQYHDCDQLATAMKATIARQKDLKGLMDKAERGAGGAFVSTIAYKTDYLAATEDLKLLEAATREKNCLTSETWRSNTIIR
jgi:hypothetical protein